MFETVALPDPVVAHLHPGNCGSGQMRADRTQRGIEGGRVGGGHKEKEKKSKAEK